MAAARILAQAPSTPSIAPNTCRSSRSRTSNVAGPEEVFLAAEVAIDGALADARPIGDHLDVGPAEAEFGKGADGLFEDGLPLFRDLPSNCRF